MGRPKKYTDRWIKRMAVKLLQYAQTASIPLKQDFASRNKFASQYMCEFARVKEFSSALKRFEDIQQKKIITLAMAGKINTTMAIFTLKNVAGWRDVQEIKGSGLGGTQVNVFPQKTIVFRDLPDDNETGNRILHEPEGSGSSSSEGKV